ncbi:enoyl-CoA hydratase [Fulvitalea axinellae]|uniref:Enoyl-CoA hydratase n=1 Tax=Fulvitalea axinellae TaxID=1182444 RepID=A0AAU9DCX5_9BACT|nr:enoyl-CoA hydratase [Fulvitalea axinellae]
MEHYTPKQTAKIAKETFRYLIVKTEGHTLRLTLNRPEKKNAMNPQFMREIAFCLDYAKHTPEIWAVGFDAVGEIFSAGADLKAFAGIKTDDGVSSIPPPATGDVILGSAFRQLHKPCIAQITGNVYAGAFLIVCGCTHVVCSENVKFSLPEALRGIWPMQVMASLTRIIPERAIVDWCTRPTAISAQEAKEKGLVTTLVKAPEDVQGETEKLLANLAKLSPTAIRHGLAALDELRSISPEHRHSFLKGKLDEVLRSKDAKEGLAAFREKRPPEWTGS